MLNLDAPTTICTEEISPRGGRSFYRNRDCREESGGETERLVVVGKCLNGLDEYKLGPVSKKVLQDL